MSEDTRKYVIQIVAINFDTTIKGQAKSYPGTEVIYKNAEGKTNTKAMHSKNFEYNKTLRGQLEALSPGDYALVTDVADGQFRKWLTIEPTEAPAEGATANPPATGKTSATSWEKDGSKPTAAVVRSNYETPEERAARQVMIVRQSSISSAVALLAQDRSEYAPGVDDVLGIAKQFEAYVLGKDYADTVVVSGDVGQVNLPQ